MSTAVLNGNHLNRIGDDAVVNDVGKSPQPGASDAFVLGRVQLGCIANTVEHIVDRRQELDPQPRTLAFVPLAPFDHI